MDSIAELEDFIINFVNGFGIVSLMKTNNNKNNNNKNGKILSHEKLWFVGTVPSCKFATHN